MRAQHIIGALLIAAGVVWSSKFPKTSEVVRREFQPVGKAERR